MFSVAMMTTSRPLLQLAERIPGGDLRAEQREQGLDEREVDHLSNAGRLARAERDHHGERGRERRHAEKEGERDDELPHEHAVDRHVAVGHPREPAIEAEAETTEEAAALIPAHAAWTIARKVSDFL